MRHSLDRRNFLRASALSSAALALAPRTFVHSLEMRPAVKPQKVIVAGAGIVGLVAAHELMQSGHEVVVFEARMRPGGRIYTLRDGFSDGLHAEGGAIDFGDAYTLLQQYIRSFDLPIVEENATEKAHSGVSLLRNVEIDGSFSPHKRMVIPKLRYDSATHIYLQ
jgi:monoamine oxidase